MDERETSAGERRSSPGERDETARPDGRSIRETARVAAFYLVVVATIGLFVSMLGELLVFAFTGWTAQGAAELGEHQFHDTVLATMMGIALLGLVVQLYRPADEFVGVLGFVMVVGLLGVVTAVVGSELVVIAAIFGSLGVVAAVLHPASGAVRRFSLPDRVEPVVLGLVAVAVIPLGLYAVDQFGLQATATDDHALFGHYAGMVTVAGTILALSVVAAVAPVGWRIAATGAGLLALVWGVASLAFPAQTSSGGLVWGVLAILWAVAFVAGNEYAHDGETTATDLSDPETPRPA
jgi:hypothetical protein